MLSLEAIRDCLEGAVPSAVATCARDGTPNVAYVSQVHFVDCSHVALSFQFFNKTRENVLANPHAVALVVDPGTGARYEIQLEYLRTETSGPLFESMKAKLAGIASHTGMSGIFRLRGSDVYRVHRIVPVPGKALTPPQDNRNLLSALRLSSQRLVDCHDLSSLLETALACLQEYFDIRHSMVLMLEGGGQRLFTVFSRGYDPSGVGSEIAVGCGVIGVAAEQRTPIRITHMTSEYSYGRAIRESLEREGLAGELEKEIPLPGLAESRSQLAVPIVAGRRLSGILYVESPEDMRFSWDDEDALVAMAAQLGSAIVGVQQSQESQETKTPDSSPGKSPTGSATTIRHYARDDSIFIEEDYLIKGVAGAIFTRLLRHYAEHQRADFTNRELRLDPTLRLPDITDNLEARLILLERRLSERGAPLRIEKTGRGRFRLRVDRPFQLVEMPG